MLCSSLIFREDIDIGLVIIGDMHKKNKCIQFKISEVQDTLTHLRISQVQLFNTSLGLEKPTDDSTIEVASVKLFLGEVLAYLLVTPRLNSLNLGV